jgi:phosphoserine phosphatase
MLRMAFRLGADLETAFAQVNDLLAETLAEDRFVTAFIGVLDPHAHVLRYVSAGQGPILHFHADRGTCSRHKPTSFPLGAMALPRPPRAAEMILAPGDMLVLLSDGIYEYGNGAGEQFGEDRVEQVVAGHHTRAMAALSTALLDAVQAFAGAAAQEDDITVVLVRREASR